MRIRSLLALLAFVRPASCSRRADSTVDPTPTAAQPKSISPEACLASARACNSPRSRQPAARPTKASAAAAPARSCAATTPQQGAGVHVHGDESIAE